MNARIFIEQKLNVSFGIFVAALSQNYTFLFHWQYFVVPEEKEMKYIDGRSYTAETQT